MPDQPYIANSPQMQELLKKLERIADSDISIILLGESGVGKSFLAQQIHHMRYGNQGLVEVSSGDLANGLADSALFGHKKGSFTNADKDRIGFIEAANGGTLFIDEIGDLSPSTQLKLLRFLDIGKFYRVGESEPRHSNPRVIVATNHDIPNQNFRNDLYHRALLST